jgi:hypothetical protein
MPTNPTLHNPSVVLGATKSQPRDEESHGPVRYKPHRLGLPGGGLAVKA